MNKKIIFGLCIFSLILLGSVPNAEASLWSDFVDWVKDFFGFKTIEETEVKARELISPYHKITKGFETETIEVSPFPLFVEEDNEWKRISEARSLKNKTWNGKTLFSCKVDNDGVNQAECLDFNATSRTIKLQRKNAKLNSIPLRIYKEEINASNKKIYRKYDNASERSLNFLNQVEEKEYNLNMGLDDILEFGEKSTTISITANSSENTFLDASTKASAPTTGYINFQWWGAYGFKTSLIWYNSSQHIPSGVTFSEGHFQWFIDSCDGGASGNLNLEQEFDSWTEGATAWGDPGNVSYNFANNSDVTGFNGGARNKGSLVGTEPFSDTADVWYDLNFTNTTALDYMNNNFGFLSFIHDTSDEAQTCYASSMEDVEAWSMNFTYTVTNNPPVDPIPLFNSTDVGQANYTDEDMNCNFLCDDPEGVGMSWYSLMLKDGVEQFSLGGSCSDEEYKVVNLESENTTIGDLWACGVILDDGTNNNTGGYQYSNNVTILGSLTTPTINLNSTTVAQTNYTNETLACNFNCNDVVGGNTITYNLDFLNQSNVPIYSLKNVSCSNPSFNSVTLEPANTTTHEFYSCSVNLTSSEAETTNTVYSNNLTIVGVSPTNVTWNSPNNNTILITNDVTYNCSADDQDGDTIYYEIYQDGSNPPSTLLSNETSPVSNTTVDDNYWTRCRAVDVYSGQSGYTNPIYLIINNATIENTSTSYSASIIEGQQQTIKLNLSYNPYKVNYTNAVLIYQNSVQTTSQTNHSETLQEYSSSFFTPLVPSGIGEFYWNVTLAYENGSLEDVQTANYTQTVTNIGIDSCSTYGNKTKEFYIFNENVPSEALNGSFEIEATVWTEDPSINATFNDNLSASHLYELCLADVNLELKSNIYIRYTMATGFTHRFYLVNNTLNNVTSNYSLYNFNTTTGISDLRITLRNKATYNYFPEIITKLQRNYISEGVWRNVQYDQSGDFGLIVFNIYEEDIDYRLVFQDRENNLLKITDSMKFACDSGICQIEVLLDPYAASAISPDLIHTLTYNNDTGNITLAWEDPTGSTSSVRLDVDKETMTGTAHICDTTQSGDSGTIICDASGYTGEVSARVYSSASPESPVVTEWIKLTAAALSGLLGAAEGALWTFGIMVSVIAFGLISPVASVITTIIGLIAILFLGIFNAITITFVIIAAVLGIAIGIKVRK